MLYCCLYYLDRNIVILVTDRRKDTELHLAARHGDVAAIRQITNRINEQMVGTLSMKNADFDAEVEEIRFAMVNDANELGETALFIAANKGHLDVVKELLRYASPQGISLKNDMGFDPLHIAANHGHLAIVQVLLDHDPGLINTFSPSINATPLISAATRGRTNVVDQLLSRDLSQLELSRSNGKNALHLAARQGHVDVVKLLLEKDPQLARRTDKKGQTALHMAVKGMTCEVVKLILSADAAIVMLPDKFGNTALHIATRKKRVEIVNELLLLPDTNVNALTRNHKTALDIAEALPPSEEILEMKDLLVRYGAIKANDLNQPRDKLIRNTVTQIRRDVHTQLEQTRKTNMNVIRLAMELRKLHRAGTNNATNSVTVVALLFATVAFAAIFSVPGDDDNSTGMTVMVGTVPFDIFFIFDSIAFFTSLAVVLVQITVVRGRTKIEMRVVKVINKLMWLASICTTIAFMSASYIVVGRHNKWAAMVVIIIGGIIMVGVLSTMTYYVLKSKRDIRAKRNFMSGSNSGSETDLEIGPIYAI
ncbi:putative ankyrin repeat-containing domain, PGG domain-containing protein [Lupinus albus]|uniref:Putative ankyrin repeat-containing domain, PGG domain-containing protein n=1 Tax=Lupinus albus TaxID=3870 RepID=A0A6A4Q9Y6_LUPAL|nr:putative ankyrin repeat-containing domain, PGG domain-containing protein [Lupinus albus]